MIDKYKQKFYIEFFIFSKSFRFSGDHIKAGKILFVTTCHSMNVSSNFQKLWEDLARDTTGPLTLPKNTCSRKEASEGDPEDSVVKPWNPTQVDYINLLRVVKTHCVMLRTRVLRPEDTREVITRPCPLLWAWAQVPEMSLVTLVMVWIRSYQLLIHPLYLSTTTMSCLPFQVFYLTSKKK